MAAILGGERPIPSPFRHRPCAPSSNSLAARLDEARDISRYLTGLLVFLGLLGTFWGLIETVGSVGSIINNLQVGGDAGSVFDALEQGLAAPLAGMGISFSSSLFGLAGSLSSAFSTCRRAKRRTASTPASRIGSPPPCYRTSAWWGGCRRTRRRVNAIDRLRQAVCDAGSNKATTAAMANLAEAIQGLVQHMRSEQQMIRDWADEQSKLNRDLRRFMEMLSRESVDR